jgi:hypothetical protein
MSFVLIRIRVSRVCVNPANGGFGEEGGVRVVETNEIENASSDCDESKKIVPRVFAQVR